MCELGGADQGGDLEGVLADGAVAQVLGVFPGGGVALLLQLQLRGRQVQVQRQVLQLLCLSLVFGDETCQHITQFTTELVQGSYQLLRIN